MRCAIYVRVSREEQIEGWSLDAQLEQCRALAALRHWQVPTSTRSQAARRRPTRALLAQWDNQNRGLEMAKGKRARALAGYWNGTLAFGYTTPKFLKEELLDLGKRFEAGEVSQNDYEEQADEMESTLDRWADKTEGDAIPHPTNASGVLLAFNQYATGLYSDADMANMLTEEGYRTTGNWGERTFSKDTVRPLLQNRFYLGETQYKGKSYPGRHPALVPKTLFEKCQHVRAQRRVRPRRSKPDVRRVYPLSRLALCACCQQPLRGQANRFGTRYYRNPERARHNCQQPMIRAEEAEAALLSFMSGIHLPEDWRERILEMSRSQLAGRGSVEQQQIRLEGKQERLAELYIEGHVSRAVYDERMAAIEGKLSALRPLPEPDLEAAGELLEDMGSLLAQTTLAEQRDLFHALFNTVYLDGRRPNHPVAAVEPKPFVGQLLDIADLPGQGDGKDQEKTSRAAGVVASGKCDTVLPRNTGHLYLGQVTLTKKK